MDWSAAHAGFVAAAYGITCVVLAGLVVSVFLRARWIKHQLRRLEAGQAEE